MHLVQNQNLCRPNSDHFIISGAMIPRNLVGWSTTPKVCFLRIGNNSTHTPQRVQASSDFILVQTGDSDVFRQYRQD